MSLKETFNKQGGWKLIHQYKKAGCLSTAISEFVILGKSRTALEILRLAAQLKTKQKLFKRYETSLREFDQTYNNSQTHESSDVVWVCWLQGIENSPEIVKKCIESLYLHLKNKKIVLITESNLENYVIFPDFIMQKWKAGIITNTHFTDLLRLELLTRYGGTWIDSTVFCTEDDDKIPAYFFDSDLFFYQMLKPGRDGNSLYMSSWYMNAKSHNKILEAAKYLCYEYWKQNDELVDYFLLHDFISIALDYYPDEWNKIVPRDNSAPHALLLRLSQEYDPKMWEAIKEQTPFHKLTYKMTIVKNGTYYYNKVLNI